MQAPEEGLAVGDHYYILASSAAADLPRMVLKHEDAFLVADRRGDFPRIPQTEFGFYVEDTRYLQQLELRLEGQAPVLLNAAVSEARVEAVVDLTNGDVRLDGARMLRGRTIRVARTVTLEPGALGHRLAIESFAGEPHRLRLAWHFAADFADVFEARGFARARRGTLLPPELDGARVRLAYRGLDGVTRVARLAFEPPPARLDGAAAAYELDLAPGGHATLALTVTAERAASGTGPASRMAPAQPGSDRDRLTAATVVQTSHEGFNRWLARARADLQMLVSRTSDGPLAYAGIPWFVAPFGRDSLIAALQLLPFWPELARGTLRFLARHQGRVTDEFTDQEPGKILHEYRQGELASCREIVFVPYYGSVDVTPLFLMLLAEHSRWTGDLGLVRELWPAVEQALGWLTTPRADGYLSYQRRSPLGLENQGWKDAHDAVMHDSGALARAPIALAEVQGYKYAALRGAAELAEQVGQAERAPELREAARRLANRFQEDFWMPDRDCYALALDGSGAPCRVIASNAAHCLWTGLVPQASAELTAARLMAADVHTGWGLRTLASGERRYNPMSYHNGSVWPHDTAIAATGFRRYGLAHAFQTLASGLLEAALHFESVRLPELFCGFPRAPGYGPTRYPTACSPQAWAAGVVFQLLATMLGFAPDARENRLTLSRPALPPWLDWVTLHGLPIRDSRVDLRVSRGRVGAAVELLDRHGDAEVVVRR